MKTSEFMVRVEHLDATDVLAVNIEDAITRTAVIGNRLWNVRKVTVTPKPRRFVSADNTPKKARNS